MFQHKKFIESTKAVEEERNFYYGNLRSIEHFCRIQQESAPELSGNILDILAETPIDFLTKD
ncbi:MAG: hypothetical protein ACKO96_43610 [Flammeovirgaceae bacterium]